MNPLIAKTFGGLPASSSFSIASPRMRFRGLFKVSGNTQAIE